MILESLSIRDFRNLSAIQMQMHPRCNVFVGANGQGKTSVLEAIHLLTRGQSFRTRVTSPLIKFHSKSLAIQAKTFAGDSIYLQKDIKGMTKILLNEKRCQRVSELTHLFPCQLFYQDLFHIIDTSSQIRRKLLDWGVFYQNPEYLSIWQSFKRTLLQRNMCLKQRQSLEALRVWNQGFVDWSEQVTECRQCYFQSLKAIFDAYVAQLPKLDCQLSYYKGWDGAKDLHDALLQQETIDRKLLYTHSGPQHADILFMTTQGKGKLEWSRGQQKMILILLKLAQATLLNRPCIYLLDDLMAELDHESVLHVYQQLHQVQGQLFITTLNEEAQNLDFFQNSRWFYLNDGQIIKTVDV
jgi:DNA replication and repair protein RecF